MKYSEFYRLIESYGWEKKTGKNKGTNHAKYVHPDFPYFIPVGRHPSQEVKPGTLN
jgi:predicted RNA binding protein YcfA (HicA-like mRNA interferase family)